MESIQFKSTLGVIEIAGNDAGIQTIRIQEEQQIKIQEQLEQPMVSSRDIDKGDAIMPENIDFGDRLEKLGIS